MKRIVDLKNDEELNAASWQAARGAVIGAARVCSFHFGALPSIIEESMIVRRKRMTKCVSEAQC
jgi:hypothetical protein